MLTTCQKSFGAINKIDKTYTIMPTAMEIANIAGGLIKLLKKYLTLKILISIIIVPAKGTAPWRR